MRASLLALIVFQLVLGCQPEESLDQRDAAASGATTDEDMNLSVDSANYSSQKVLAVSLGDRSDISEVNIVIALDIDCTNNVVTFTGKFEGAVELTVAESGTYFVCVEATLNSGRSVTPFNNGLKVVLEGSSSTGGPSNESPIADAGADQSTSEGSVVTLNGSGSSDPDGDSITYSWSQISGLSVSLSSATVSSPQFTLPQMASSSNLVFQLTVSDGASSNTDSVTVSVSATNSAPTLSFSAPADNDDYAAIGTTINATYVAADSDNSEATIEMYYKRSNTGDCDSSGTQIGSSFTVATATGTLGWDTTGIDDGTYYICGKIDDGSNAAVHVYTGAVRLYATGVCTWVGSDDNDWTNTSNYRECASVPDTSTEWVVVLEGTEYSPTLTADTTIAGFAAGYGGGTINFDPDVDLTLSNTNAFQSSVEVQGTNGSNFGSLKMTTTHFYITNEATLTVGTSMYIWMNYNRRLYVGDGSTIGHLLIDHDESDKTYWPQMKQVSGGTNIGARGIQVTGVSAAAKSSISIEGLYLESAYNYDFLIFDDYYQIKQMDKMILATPPNRPGYAEGKAYFLFNDCTNATVDDTTWSEIEFKYFPLRYAMTQRIDASGCASLPTTISITGNGAGYTSETETDPNNIFAWTSEASTTSFNCVFTNGGGDGIWKNDANWSGCNDREGYPDYRDTARIPSGLTVTLTGGAAIDSIASGAGGGTITINSDSSLAIVSTTTASINSDVTIEGASGATNASLLGASGLYVLNGATLTVGESFSIITTNSSYGQHTGLHVGNGTTHGNLYTKSGMNVANKPSIMSLGSTASYITGGAWLAIEGTSSNNSLVSVDGFTVGNSKNWDNITFTDYYEIVKFGNITTGNVTQDNMAAITFTSCANGVFTDTTWSDLTFGTNSGTPSYNIEFTGTSCDGAATITVSGSGSGYGSGYEADTGADDIQWL